MADVLVRLGKRRTGCRGKLSEASCAFETAWLPAASRSALCPAGHGRPPAEASRLLHLWIATAATPWLGRGRCYLVSWVDD